MHDWRAEQPAVAARQQVQLAPPVDCCACCASGAALGDDLFLLRLLGSGCLLIPKCIWRGVRGVGRHLHYKFVNGF